MELIFLTDVMKVFVANGKCPPSCDVYCGCKGKCGCKGMCGSA